MIQLRSFQTRDLARLHQLDRDCFPQEIAYSKAELQYFLSHPRCSCWIAERPESKVAGFVIIERASRNGEPAGHIVTLDVDPAERRRGLGTLLMQTAEEQMKQEGAGVMSLEVAQNNLPRGGSIAAWALSPGGESRNIIGGGSMPKLWRSRFDRCQQLQWTKSFQQRATTPTSAAWKARAKTMPRAHPNLSS